MDDDIQEALQVAATCDDRFSGGGYRHAPATADERAIRNFRRKLSAFLRDLDGEITVGEIRSALED